MNTNHHYLRYTIQLLFLTLYYVIYKLSSRELHPIEYLLAILLLLVMIMSQMFWKNPIKGSSIHKADAVVAKSTICCFILYVLFYKFKLSFLLFVLFILLSFACSHYFAMKEWCSNKHLFFHGTLHIACFFATFYAFIP